MRIKSLIAFFMIFILTFFPLSTADAVKRTVENKPNEIKTAIAYCKTPLKYKNQYRYVAFANLTKETDSIKLSIVKGRVRLLQNLLPPENGEKTADFKENEILFQHSGVILLHNNEGGELKLSTDELGVQLAPTNQCDKLTASLATLHQKKLHETVEEKYKPLEKVTQFRKKLFEIYSSLPKTSSETKSPTGMITAKGSSESEFKPKYVFAHATKMSTISEIIKSGALLSPRKLDPSNDRVGVFTTYGDVGLRVLSSSNPIIYLKPTTKRILDFASGGYIKESPHPGYLLDSETRNKLGLPEIETKRKYVGRPPPEVGGEEGYRRVMKEGQEGQLLSEVERYYTDKEFRSKVNELNPYHQGQEINPTIVEGIADKIPSRYFYKIGLPDQESKTELIDLIEDKGLRDRFIEIFGRAPKEAIEIVPKSKSKALSLSKKLATEYYKSQAFKETIPDFSKIDWSKIDYSEISWPKISVALTHYTEEENIPQILKEGILPSELTEAEKHGRGGYDVVFASPSDPESTMVKTNIKVYLKPDVYKGAVFASRLLAGKGEINLLTDPEIREDLREEFENVPKLKKEGLERIDVNRRIGSEAKAIGGEESSFSEELFEEDFSDFSPEELNNLVPTPGKPAPSPKEEITEHKIKVATSEYNKKILLTDFLRYIYDSDFREKLNQLRIEKRKSHEMGRGGIGKKELYPEAIEVITEKISTNDILKIGLPDQETRAEMIKNLKEEDIFEINGQPLEEALIVSKGKDFGRAKRLAEEYYESLVIEKGEIDEIGRLLDKVTKDFKKLEKDVKGKAKTSQLISDAKILERSYRKLRKASGEDVLPSLNPIELVKNFVNKQNYYSLDYALTQTRNNLLTGERALIARLLSSLSNSKKYLTSSQKNSIQSSWSKLSTISSKIESIIRKDRVSTTLFKTLDRAKNSNFRYKIPRYLYHIKECFKMGRRAYYAIKSQFTLSNLGRVSLYAIPFAMGHLIGRAGKIQGDRVKILMGHSLRLAGYLFIAKAAWNVGWTAWVAYASTTSVYAGITAGLGALTTALTGFVIFGVLTSTIILLLPFTCLLSIRGHLPWCLAHRFTPARRLVVPDRDRFFLTDVPMIERYPRGSVIPVQFKFKQKSIQGYTKAKKAEKASCKVVSSGMEKICLGEFDKGLKEKIPANSLVKGSYEVTRIPKWFENAIYRLLKKGEAHVKKKTNKNYLLFGRNKHLCVQAVGFNPMRPPQKWEEYCFPLGEKISGKFLIKKRYPFISLKLKDGNLICEEWRGLEEEKRSCRKVNKVLGGKITKKFETTEAKMPPEEAEKGLTARLQIETNKGKFVSRTLNLSRTETLDKSDLFQLVIENPYRSDEMSGLFGRDHSTGFSFIIKNNAPESALQALDATVEVIDYPKQRCGDDNKVSSSYINNLNPGEIFKFSHNNFCDALDNQALQFEIKIESVEMDWNYCIKCEKDNEFCGKPIPGSCEQG